MEMSEEKIHWEKNLTYNTQKKRRLFLELNAVKIYFDFLNHKSMAS